MMPCLIELQDHNIRIRNEEAVLARSPGFANIAGPVPVFGEAARSQARQHPRHSFNQFWSQLSLDPLIIKNKHFRHAADLAYSHLDSLTKTLNLDQGVVLGVPSNYSRAQLSVLMGVVKQCAFNAVGLVDLTLLQAAGSPAEACVIIDLQLHQAVLTSFRKTGGHLVKDRVVQIPFAGLLALQDAWVNMITDAFIRQSRFDPQRDAESEQYIANQLSNLITSSQSNNELLLEINLKGTIHQARMTRADFEQKSQTIFARINKELNDLLTPDSTAHIAAAHMSLPGLTQSIPGLIALDDELAMVSCLQHLNHIKGASDSLQFVTRLPLATSASFAVPAAQTRMPTHVVIQHKAILLPFGRLIIGTAPAKLESARVVPFAPDGFSDAIALVRGNRGLQLELHTSSAVLHNGRPALDGELVVMGDMLTLGASELQLIMVEQTS
jgi:hypothetical protein